MMKKLLFTWFMPLIFGFIPVLLEAQNECYASFYYSSDPGNSQTLVFQDASFSSSPVINWLWDFGDGSSGNQPAPSHTYLTGGSYNVTLTIITQDGCQSTYTEPVQIFDPNGCYPAFYWSVEGDGLTLKFAAYTQNNMGALSWSWDFGDGSTGTGDYPIHTYNAYGVYTVTVTMTGFNGCVESYTQDVVVEEVPPYCNAYFGAYPFSDDYLTLQFTDYSYSNATINSWAWNFGDGAASTEQNPTHTYSSIGTYEVSLTIGTTDGCSSTNTTLFVVDSIVTPPLCQPEFYYFPSDPVSPLSIQFIDKTLVAGVISSWHWDFGDGTISEEQNPLHTYAAPGLYPVILTVTSDDCGSLTVTQVVFVDTQTNPGCQSDFYYYSNYPTSAEYFFYGYSNYGSDVTSWEWNFGDGTTSTGPTAVHTFPQPGDYQITLTTMTVDSCVSTVTYPLQAIDPTACNPSFGYSYLFGGQVSFYDYSFAPGGVTSWSWDFGDGATSNEANPTHTYTAEGNYTVVLTISNGDCSASYSQEVWMDAWNLQTCFASFGYYQTNPNNLLEMTFVDYSYAVNPITSWTWTFPDGTVSNEQNPVYAFPGYGAYDVTLTIQTDDCSNTVTYPIYVDSVQWVDYCYASFYYYQNQNPEDSSTVNFFADAFGLYNLPGLPTVNYSYFWNFGDGATSTEMNPVHIYSATGAYDVSLTIADSNGTCNETVTYPIQVGNNGWWFDGCYASFYFNQDPANPATYQFINSSYGDVSAYNWDFGDGSTSTDANPVHTYAAEGIYNVTLSITTTDGCTSSYPMSLFYGDNFWYPIGCQALFQADVNGLNVNFMDWSATVFGTLMSWNWDFGDGTFSNQQNPSHSYTAPGVYTVVLKIETNGCTSAYEMDVDLLTGLTGNGNAFAALATSTRPDPVVSGWKLNVSPNPASDHVSLRFTAASDDVFETNIVDVNGRTLQHSRHTARKGDNLFGFDVSSLSSGVYFLNVVSGNVQKTVRFVKL